MAINRAGFPRSLKRLYDQLDAFLKTKVENQTKTATTTLANDDELLFAMAANTKYRFRAVLWFDTTAAADLKVRHTGPASPALVRITRSAIVPGAAAESHHAVDTAYSSADIALTGAGTDGGWIELEGIIHNGANAGNFAIQWAQNTSDAGNSIVRAGSYIQSWQVD